MKCFLKLNVSKNMVSQEMILNNKKIKLSIVKFHDDVISKVVTLRSC